MSNFPDIKLNDIPEIKNNTTNVNMKSFDDFVSIKLDNNYIPEYEDVDYSAPVLVADENHNILFERNGEIESSSQALLKGFGSAVADNLLKNRDLKNNETKSVGDILVSHSVGVIKDIAERLMNVEGQDATPSNDAKPIGKELKDGLEKETATPSNEAKTAEKESKEETEKKETASEIKKEETKTETPKETKSKEVKKSISVPDSVQTGIIANYTQNYGTRGWAYAQKTVNQEWKNAGGKTDGNICTLDGRYLVAVSPKFGKVGDKIDITLDNGQVIPATIADVKGSDATSEWGHVLGSNGRVDVVEWEIAGTSQSSLSSTLKDKGWYGVKVDKIDNLG